MLEAIIIGSLILLIYWFLYNKENRKFIYLAAAISFIWVFFSGLYGYRGNDYVILGLNLFAFFAWTTGLMILKKAYDLLKFKGKYWVFIIAYMVAIITAEYIGYNLLNIKLTTNYSGIFGLEAMHMPWYGKFYYLTMGWIFVRIEDIIKFVKSKLKKKRKKKKTSNQFLIKFRKFTNFFKFF